jgi:hypothetical protein
MRIRIQSVITEDELLAAQYLAALLRVRLRNRVLHQSSRAQKVSVLSGASLDYDYGDSDKKGRSLEK